MKTEESTDNPKSKKVSQRTQRRHRGHGDLNNYELNKG
jgi:hypothetical protein